MAENGERLIRTTTWSAGPGCHGGCGVIAHVKDGKLVKIEVNERDGVVHWHTDYNLQPVEF